MKLTIPGEPVPKQSTRFGKGRAYQSPKVEAFERKVRFYAIAQKLQRLAGPLSVSAAFYLGNARRVDLDNLWKGVSDALNGVAWEDDSQLVEVHLSKAIDRASPRIEVRVEAAP